MNEHKAGEKIVKEMSEINSMLIKRWREDPGSVSRAELRAAWAVAYDAAYAAAFDDDAARADAARAAYAAYAAADAAYAADARAAWAADAAADAAYVADARAVWVKRYEELTNAK